MIPFKYHQPSSLDDAQSALTQERCMPIAGGTTMIDLMKLNVLKPTKVVHVRSVLDESVETKNGFLVIGGGCTMAGLADHEAVRDRFPVIRQSLILAASPQIRNMATIGGNLLQRTRSPYYRHTDMPLPEEPASRFGEGVETTLLAVLGNGGRLVGMYPGDFAVTVTAFDGQLELSGPDGVRTVAARDFYQVPGESFQYTTLLQPGELITRVKLPISEPLRNSYYLKVRERSSYAFALASAAVGLQINNDQIEAAHVGIGGLGSIPWHSPEAEAALIGKPPTDATFEAAADAALQTANPPLGLEYKVPLAKRTLIRAWKTLRDQGPLSDEQLWAMQHGRS
ncbi:FAD binding domain-containing protein [Neorhodopirellula pilleata]|uniref:4-hydroxybenzoyl-CoA reductase subunit beta n=1 Tax=Neorhodopirellula pilleata TaxID=2714738 RepID=A0A5C6A1C5_9BACT|nr:xanthine dehydrogenase family protein subunit M [Neorhodopirellula pilleata]TWT93127.1 4-hydroxybenzoyl-CoA reductase subunit beta [Neorhodopirellula pilleata]